jgi:hypothetical protein
MEAGEPDWRSKLAKSAGKRLPSRIGHRAGAAVAVAVRQAESGLSEAV